MGAAESAMSVTPVYLIADSIAGQAAHLKLDKQAPPRDMELQLSIILFRWWPFLAQAILLA